MISCGSAAEGSSFRHVRRGTGLEVCVGRSAAIHEEEQEVRIVVRLTKRDGSHHENSGTNSAGSLTTDSVWNVSLRENAVDVALMLTKQQDDYLRRLTRSTITRYRSGSLRSSSSSTRR